MGSLLPVTEFLIEKSTVTMPIMIIFIFDKNDLKKNVDWSDQSFKQKIEVCYSLTLYLKSLQHLWNLK